MPDTADLPFFHESSGTVRFWVTVDEKMIGASVGQLALHHCFRPTAQGDDPVDTFRSHLADIEAAVRRRVAQGALEPVMLREFDLRTPSAQGRG
jgi:hypothetical protein